MDSNNRSSKLLIAAVLVSLGSISAQAHENKHEANATKFEPMTTDFGMYDPDLKPTTIIEMDMSDLMRFTPSQLRVKEGEVVQINLTNNGAMEHEFVLGTHVGVEQHAEIMKKYPDMEHSPPFMVHVKPGEKARRIRARGTALGRRRSRGEFSRRFACVPGQARPGHARAVRGPGGRARAHTRKARNARETSRGARNRSGRISIGLTGSRSSSGHRS